MLQEQKEKVFFMVNDFIYHLYRNRKIDFKKYIQVLQMIDTCSECDVGLGDVSNLFLLL